MVPAPASNGGSSFCCKKKNSISDLKKEIHPFQPICLKSLTPTGFQCFWAQKLLQSTQTQSKAKIFIYIY